MKENDKILISKLLLKATFVLLVISVFLKLCGLNVFGADTGNAVLVGISNFIDKYRLKSIIDCVLLFVQIFLIFRIATINTNTKRLFIYTTIGEFLFILIQYIVYGLIVTLTMKQKSIYYAITSIFILVILPIFIDLKEKTPIKESKNNLYNKLQIALFKLKRPAIVVISVSIYQLMIMFLRNATFGAAVGSIYDIILNFDYIILLLISNYIYLKKNNNIKAKICFDFDLSSLLNNQLSIDEIKEGVLKYKEFKKKYRESNKVDKITIILYIIFSTLSELINLALVIFIAYLNNALIECLFIITSFLISRKVFGAFHLKSAIQCWMMSNISFYLLSKLTINVGVTFIIPILCGIALSYITSKFIKKTNKNLYKGISEKDLLDITKDKKLTELELNILKKYYCEGINIDKMTFIYHYSRAQLYRYKANAENKIAS